jgi:hypothetical protein
VYSRDAHRNRSDDFAAERRATKTTFVRPPIPSFGDGCSRSRAGPWPESSPSLSPTSDSPSENLVRSLILVALLAAAIVSGCGIAESIVHPAHEPPSPAAGEQPINVIPVTGQATDTVLSLRVYDRSLAIEKIRSATKAELADVEGLDANAIASYVTVAGEIMVTWLGDGCQGNGDLFVEAGVSQIVIVPIEGAPCQADPTIRGVVLAFAPSVDLERINFGIVPRETAGR